MELVEREADQACGAILVYVGCGHPGDDRERGALDGKTEQVTRDVCWEASGFLSLKRDGCR
jgi:hypothetical protein